VEDTQAVAPAIDRSDTTTAPAVDRLGTPFGAGRIIPGEHGQGPPSFAFLAIVSIVSLVSDIASKLWAEHNLDGYPGIVHIWENHVAFVLAPRGGHCGRAAEQLSPAELGDLEAGHPVPGH